MKASELRIGNLVYLKLEIAGESFICAYPVASINCDATLRLTSDNIEHENYSGGTIGCYAIKRIQPIPLTEEWLVKFGFVKKSHSECFLYEGDSFTLEEIGVGVFEYNLMDNDFSKLSPIIYVHQLQNLYFALTGTELTLK